MQLTLRDELLFVTIELHYRGAALTLTDVLVDTGSAGTIFAIDALAPLGIVPEPEDVLRVIKGVGGSEVVFMRSLDSLILAGHEIPKVEIEIGGMDYGFQMQGILGLDLLLRAGATLDMQRLTLEVLGPKLAS